VGGIERLRRILADGQSAWPLSVIGVPNARLVRDVVALELLMRDDGPATVGELQEQLAVADTAGVDPEELWTLGNEIRYDVRITWSSSGALDSFDALFLPREPASAAHAAADEPSSVVRRTIQRPWSAYANNPLQGTFSQQLVPDVRRMLENLLPEHMLPSAYVLLDALPVTSSGKIDRRKLPAPSLGRPVLDTAYVVPRTEVEETLAALWVEVLGLERVGIYDDFFSDLGGHSLLATQVTSRIRTAFEVELPLQMFFETPTIAELAAAVAERQSMRGHAELGVIQKVDRGTPMEMQAEVDQLTDAEVEARIRSMFLEEEE
jgi:acyl carrier protein